MTDKVIESGAKVHKFLNMVEKLEQSTTKGPWVVPTGNVFRVLSLKGKKAHKCILETPEAETNFGMDKLVWNEKEGPEMAANATFISAAKMDIPIFIAIIRKMIEQFEDDADSWDDVLKACDEMIPQ